MILAAAVVVAGCSTSASNGTGESVNHLTAQGTSVAGWLACLGGVHPLALGDDLLHRARERRRLHRVPRRRPPRRDLPRIVHEQPVRLPPRDGRGVGRRRFDHAAARRLGEAGTRAAPACTRAGSATGTISRDRSGASCLLPLPRGWVFAAPVEVARLDRRRTNHARMRTRRTPRSVTAAMPTRGPRTRTIRRSRRRPPPRERPRAASTERCATTPPAAPHATGRRWFNAGTGFHGIDAKADLTWCQGCHGARERSISTEEARSTACSTCHTTAEAHPTDWQGVRAIIDRVDHPPDLREPDGRVRHLPQGHRRGGGPEPVRAELLLRELHERRRSARGCHANGPGQPNHPVPFFDNTAHTQATTAILHVELRGAVTR